MKYLSIILVFTLLGLSFVPCSDSVIASSAIHHEHEDHSGCEHGAEGCSPFCTCDCCSISVENHEFELGLCLSQHELFIFDMNDNCNYSFDYSFDFNIGIWNPPRVA